MMKAKYWIVVVSKDHIARGVEGGFMQANHGKSLSLKKLSTGDWVIFYSPKQYKMSKDFVPYRRNVTYYQCKETPLVHLINDLDFIENKKAWGYKFRFGFFEIGEDDFEQIRFEMMMAEHTFTNQLT